MSFPVAPPPLKLPTQHDLPYAGDEAWDSWHRLLQVDRVLGTLYLTRHGRESSIGNRTFVYHEAAPPACPLLPKQSGPNLFVVPDTTPELRRSRMRWDDGR